MVDAVEPRKEPKDTVKAKAKATFKEGDERIYYKCGETGHIRSRCPHSKKKVPKTNFTFAIGNGGGLQDNHWILDSGSSRHLVNDLSLLVNPEDCHGKCVNTATDGGVLRVTSKTVSILQLLHLVSSTPYDSSTFSTPRTSSVISFRMVSSSPKDAYSNIEEGGVC